MKSTLWWLGLIFGTLSVVMLVKHGFDYGFVAPLQLVLDYYEQAMQVLFGWAEPWISQQLARVGALFGWELHLYPHWKHAFVLFGVYLRAISGVGRWIRNGGEASVKLELSDISMAAFLAVICSIAAGLVPLGSEALDLPAEFWLLATVVIGIFLIDISPYLLRPFSRETFSILARCVGTLGLSWFVLERMAVNGFRHPGIILIGVLIVLYGLYYLFLGARIYVFRAGWSWRDRVDSVLQHDGAKIGLTILGTLLGAAFFVATNAGLKLAGL